MGQKRKTLKMISAGVLCCLLLMREPVYAGSLNSNEQELMDIIRGTYTYEGITYRVKEDYIRVAEEYLLQDSVDCTDEQKQKALDEMFSSIRQGISEGYLEAVTDTKTEKNTETGPDTQAERNTQAEKDTQTGKSTKTEKNTEDEERLETGNHTGSEKSSGETSLRSEKTEAPSPVILALEAFPEQPEPDTEEPEEGFLCLPEYPMRIVKTVSAGLAVSILAIFLYALRAGVFSDHKKRRQRHLISGLLTGMAAVTTGILLLTAMYAFGLFNGSILSQSFETSGYYRMRKEEAGKEITDILIRAGLPESFYVFSEQEDHFEQKMRSQVYGRNDRIPEIESISVAGTLHRQLEALKVKRTLRSEKGTLKLADRISGILLKKSTVPGIADWWETRESMNSTMMIVMAAMTGMLFAEGVILWFLQSRRSRASFYLSAGLLFGCLAGISETLWISRSMQTDPAVLIAGVWELFRSGVLYAGLECCAVILFTGVILAAVGKISDFL